jgi:hypothetical protein
MRVELPCPFSSPFDRCQPLVTSLGKFFNSDRDGKVLPVDEGAMGTVVLAKERGKWWIIAA